MLRRGSVTMSLFTGPAEMFIGWCWVRRASRRRRSCTVRLGNKRRTLVQRSRPIVRFRFVVVPLRRLKKLLMDGRLIDSFCLYFSSIYPSLFPFI
ncbi:hypothetical protein IFM89_005666 [Coptis chinensis]|uniref:Uncharacterized protein n=1 Tax=Coptis chinensis TaxID=261450 RepID=A0A835GUH4_9MAGN|nr:hypothetical protein IFM89_005666 [Coptis chinensis]